MKTKRLITISIFVVAIISLGILVGTNPTPNVRAQGEENMSGGFERVAFASVGITSGQTLRVTVSNTILQNTADLPPGPVRVVIAFRAMNGQLIRNRGGEVIRRAVELDRGDSALLDLDYDQLPPGPSRAQIRPVATMQYPTMDIAEHKPMVVGAEVINNVNGRTQFGTFTSPAVVRGFNPQPDPPSPE
jgi:hypothetical protein